MLFICIKCLYLYNNKTKYIMNKYELNLFLTSAQLDLLNSALDSKIAVSNQIITRAKLYPSETIKSKIIIQKHNDLIFDLVELKNHISENSQF